MLVKFTLVKSMLVKFLVMVIVKFTISATDLTTYFLYSAVLDHCKRRFQVHIFYFVIYPSLLPPPICITYKNLCKISKYVYVYTM